MKWYGDTHDKSRYEHKRDRPRLSIGMDIDQHVIGIEFNDDRSALREYR